MDFQLHHQDYGKSGDESPSFSVVKPSSARQELCRVCPTDIIAPRPSSCSAKITLALARDKEALLEEVLDLKKAYFDQEYHLKLHKVHAHAIDQENNKLVKDVEELELKFGLEAPRMGGHRRLKTRIIGLKSRLMDKQNTCCSQSLELGLLRRDLRVTRTKEIEIERDIFAAEIERLQKVVRRLQSLHTSITNQNAEVHQLQKKIERLEGAKKSLITLMDLTRLNIKKTNQENEVVKEKAAEAQAFTKKAQRKLNELQEHSILLSGLLERERREKRKMERKVRFLVSETRRFEQEAIAARNKALMASLPKPQEKKTKKKKKKPKTPDSVDSNAMVDLEEAFLRSVEVAAVEFIETVPASQPPSPTKSNKSEDELQEQHGEFEVRKDCFTEKVDVAELKFLQAMEEIEYGRAMSQSKEQEAAMQKKMLVDAEAARQAAEDARRRVEEKANRVEEERRRLQEESERLAKELAALRAVGANGKRWNKEEVAISFGDDKLVPADFKCQVLDKGTQIEIDIEIKSPTTAQAERQAGWDDAVVEAERLRKLAEEEAERLKNQMEDDAMQRKKEMEEEEARRKKEMEEEETRRKKEMEEEETRRKKEMEEEEARRKKEMEDEETRRKKEMEGEEARHKKEMEEEETRRKKEMEEEEVRRKKEMEDVEARRKKEMEDVEARRKEMEEEEARRRKAMEEDEAARRAAVEEEARRRQVEFDEEKRKMQAELDAAKRAVVAADVKPAGVGEPGFFDPDMHQAIKENIQDVLGHLENISEIITEKAEEQASSSSGTKEDGAS